MSNKQVSLHPLRWSNFAVGKEIHAIPLNDDIDHIQDGEMCPCHPRVDDGNIFVHYAVDNRELYLRHVLKMH